MFQKLTRRLKDLTNVKWNREKVAKMADVWRLEYMSSEESEVDEETQKVKYYNVRKF